MNCSLFLQRFVLTGDPCVSFLSSLPVTGNLVEVAFADLDADPVGTMEQLYEQLGWGEEFADMEPVYRQYTARLAGFKKNDHLR